LATRVVEPNPFFEPDFLVPCARHFEGYADTTLVVACEQDVFRGVLPIMNLERPRIPPRPVLSTRGRPTAVRLLGTPLLDATCPDPAMGALLDAMHGASKKGDWPGIVLMDKAGDAGPALDSLHRMCAARRFPVFTKETWERGVVRRGGEWERPLRRGREKSIERTRRALARDTGAEVTLTDRTLDPVVLDEFLAMEVSGWKGREGGLAFGKDPDTTAWLHDWYACWVPTGRLTILSLNAGDVPIAIEFFIRGGDGIFCFRGAYDEAYSKYGPGAIVLSDCMKYLLEHTDAQWIDSGTDKDNAFLLELLPERRALSTLFIGIGGLLDRGIVSALPAMTRALVAQRQVRDRWSRARVKDRASLLSAGDPATS
jgi:hypothetical protein